MSIKVGIAGLRRGRSFVNVFNSRDDCQIAAVCDLNAERAEAAGKELNAVAFSDFDKFCEHDLDAIVVATPLPAHAECSIKAMEAGKHVLCEVPAVRTLEEAEQLARTVERTGKKYMFAENMNYFPVVRMMDEFAKEGKLGKLIYAEGEYIHDCRSIMADRDDGLGGGVSGNRNWRAALPPILYCTHDLGTILMIMEDRIVSASGRSTGCNVAPELGAIDMEVGIFHTAKGAVVKMLCGFSIERHPSFHFISLYGTSGSIEMDRYNGMNNMKAYFKGEHQRLTDISVDFDRYKLPSDAQSGGHGVSEYYMVDDFVRCILDDTKPVIDVYEGLDYTAPGICANLSAQRGGELVEVPDFRPK